MHQKLNVIPQARREEIWNSYWNMSYNERKQWMFHNVERTERGRSTKEHVSRRTCTYVYRLTDAEGVSHTVCKDFFLATLGYDRKNDKAVVTAFRTDPGAVTPHRDKRGKHEPANKKDR